MTSPSADADVPVWVADDDCDRQRLLRQLRERHWTMLVISILIIAASFAFELRSTGHVAASWLPFSAFPPMCGSRAFFGVDCPGCGLTRSFVALASGDFAESFRLHRVGWLLAAAVMLQIPYRIFALCELRTRVSQRTWPTWFGYTLIAALIINWLAKMTLAI